MSAHLKQAAVAFTVRLHADYPFPIKTPEDFASALGYRIERITKSVFLSANQGKHVIAVCSINKKMQFGLIAGSLQCGRLQIASKNDLSGILGYPPKGVSPFGVSCPVYVDRGIMAFETILVGGGEAGVEIEITPEVLVKATAAKVLDFTEAE